MKLHRKVLVQRRCHVPGFQKQAGHNQGVQTDMPGEVFLVSQVMAELVATAQQKSLPQARREALYVTLGPCALFCKVSQTSLTATCLPRYAGRVGWSKCQELVLYLAISRMPKRVEYEFCATVCLFTFVHGSRPTKPRAMCQKSNQHCQTTQQHEMSKPPEKMARRPQELEFCIASRYVVRVFLLSTLGSSHVEKEDTAASQGGQGRWQAWEGLFQRRVSPELGLGFRNRIKH